MADSLYGRIVLDRTRRSGHGIPRLRALAKEALTFSLDEFDPSPLGKGANAHVVALHELRRQLANRFFESIYVERPESDALLEAARRTPGVTLVSGPRGAGKSTMLLRLHHELTAEFQGSSPLRLTDLPSHSVHYLNLKKAGPALRTPGSPERRNQRVCGLLYDLVLDQLVPPTSRVDWRTVDPEISNFFAGFREFQLQEAESFRELWKSIEMRVLADRVDPRAIIASSDELTAMHERAERAFGENDEDQLTTLLRFLAAAYGHRCIFLIDNVDRYTQQFHLELIERIRELAHSVLDVGFVVSIRSDNLDAILDQRKADATIAKIELDHAVEVPDGPACGRPLAEEVFRSRLGFLISFLDENALTGPDTAMSYRQQVLEVELAAAGFGDIESFLIRSRELSDDLRIRQGGNANPTFSTLMEWHNHSLRSALAQLFEVASCALTGHDAFFPRPMQARRTDQPFIRRDFQNLLLRHLIFGDRRFPSAPITTRVYDGDRLVEGPPVNFQRLKILQILASNRTTMRFGRLTEAFGDLGVSEDVLRTHVIDLMSTRGFESEGLVSAEVTQLGGEDIIDPQSPVALRPAGELFLRFVASSCEYLFWCAMLARPADWQDYPDRWKRMQPTEADIDDELFRAEIAREYVEFLLLPRALAELEAPSLTRAQAELHRQRLRKNFSSGHDSDSWFIIPASCASIAAFLHTSDGDQKRRLKLEGEADRVQRSARQALADARDRDRAVGTESGHRNNDDLDLRTATSDSQSTEHRSTLPIWSPRVEEEEDNE